MGNSSTTLLTEATPLTPETKLDFRKKSEHVKSFKDYKNSSLDILSDLAENEEDIQMGINDLETYANQDQAQPEKSESLNDQYRNYIATIGEYLALMRSDKLDRNWSLDESGEASDNLLMKAMKKVANMTIGNGTDERNSKKNRRMLRGVTERDLLQSESKIGREIFGEIPSGTNREFFNLDKDTWIWYEEYNYSDTSKRRSTTTRYEVKQTGILKAQDGAEYVYLEGDELRNLTVAISQYYARVLPEVYQHDSVSGGAL